MSDELASRILACLEEKPRSISEIARELDEEKYEVSKLIEELDEQDHINTHRIGRSTACILNEDRGDPDDVSGAADDEDAEVARDTADNTPRQDTSTAEPDTGNGGEEPVEEDVSGVAGAVAGTAGGVTDTPAPGPDAGSALQGSGRGEGPRTVGIVSGKGGVGKTVVTLNIGAALMEFGENVIVMDADAEMPNLGIHLGIHTYPTSLKEVVEQDVHIMSAMHVDNNSGLRVIPTSLSAEPASEAVGEAIGMIPDNYTVLVDSPPGYERPVERVIATCDELVFVTTPELPALADTFKLYQEAQEAGKQVLGVVVNMFQSSKNHLSIAEVEEALEMPVLGVVNQSKLVPRSIMDNQPLVSYKPHAKPSRSFKEIAADLSGYQYETSLLDRFKGFIQ